MVSAIRTFVFMDCETTGLERWARITELCMVGIQVEHLLAAPENELPRALNKLTLCFNPRRVVHPQSTDMTRLDNNMLEHFRPFSEDTVILLAQFINHLPQPVCLVAHNGHKFDFPILQNHLKAQARTMDVSGVLAIDTLQLFRQHHKLQLEKLRLQEEQDQEQEKKRLQGIPIELMDDDWDDLISQRLDELENDAEFLQRALQAQKKNETTPKKNDVTGNGNATPENTKREGKSSSKKKLEFGQKMPSFKLGDVYERMTNLPVLQSHEAEGDVIMMARCAAILGQEFVALANEMAVDFVV